MSKNYLIPAAVLVVCGAQAALADDADSKLSLTVEAQSALSPRGTFQPGGGAGSISDLGTLNAGLAGNTGSTTLRRLAFHDFLSPGASVGAEVGYAVTPAFEPFVRLNYGEYRGRSATVADVSAPGIGLATAVNANVGDRRSTALDLGSRYYFTDSSKWRPFVEGYAGADHTNALSGDVAAANAQFDLGTSTLLPSATRFNAGISAGTSYRISTGATFRLAMGGDYVAAQRYQSPVYSPLGISAVNIGDRQWNLAAQLGVTYHL